METGRDPFRKDQRKHHSDGNRAETIGLFVMILIGIAIMLIAMQVLDGQGQARWTPWGR